MDYGVRCALEAEELGATGGRLRPLLVTGVAWVTSSSNIYNFFFFSFFFFLNLSHDFFEKNRL